ncbi:hypothetical protein HJC23_007822 [Cyclotella cryptica]|uniref:HSF-type DNA-binding domain-containing protein n=1 Tax=Cyclotella cryptica TaxID=29204 RepID=A0ABD3R2C4_9STRA|eukprot:CCRYP_000120-RA/>CCRYP_000120-RA protein AED:0.14 eAED:0.14 QI:0/-1/0/1/-1/1/1/0/360
METPSNTKTQDAASFVKTFPVRRRDAGNVCRSEDEITENDLKQTNFAEKLYMLLHMAEFQDVLHWLPSGDAFCVTDQDAFESKIISKYFPSAKFHSFARRMRRWGFHRVESRQERSNGIITFRCVHFRRGRPDLCKLMCDDRQTKKRKQKNKKARGIAVMEGSHPYISSLKLAITDPHEIAAAWKQNQLASLPPQVMASAAPTVGLQHLNASSSELCSYFRQFDPTLANFMTTLPFQQAFKQNPTMDPYCCHDRHAFGCPSPENTFHWADPRTQIKMIDNTISPLAHFHHSIQPAFLPFTSKRIERGELLGIRDRIEAELAVVSRMRQLKQRSLSLAMARVAVASSRESVLLSHQGSQDT